MALFRPLAALHVLLSASSVSGYGFNIVTPPTQCQNISIEITGTDGKPPYSALIVPWGSTQLSSGIEVRRVVETQFTSTSTSFQIKYPTNSQFVLVVSDSAEFGNGGTTALATVLASNDASCFEEVQVAPEFKWATQPVGVLTQCQATRIYWDPSQANGDPTFQGVIPQGQSRSITVPGTLTDESVDGFGRAGFNFTPSVRTGTNYILVGGDGRGRGSGGSVQAPIQPGLGATPDSSCLNDLSPSATPSPAAGGAYPTSTDGTGTSGGSGDKTNVGAIVGGVIGGVASLIILLLIALFFWRRKHHDRSTKERPVDLLQGDDIPRRDDLPQYYQPEPFMVPDPTETGSQYPMSESNAPETSGPSERPVSTYTTTTDMRSGTPDIAGGLAPSVATTRKSAGGPRAFRAVNIVQHDDAGPSAPASADEPETVELPPAYTNLRK